MTDIYSISALLVQFTAIIKKWFDDVLTYGFAYGSKGDKVKGKEFGVAISIGGLEKIMKIAELRWMS